MKKTTERMKEDETFKKSEQLLTIVMNSILTGIVVIDTETQEIFDVNPLAIELIGLPKEEIIGKVCHEFICPVDKGKCSINDSGQTIVPAEGVLIRGDGTKISVLKSITPIAWQDRSYILESFIDITERKKAEELQAQLLEQLEKTNKELENFAYVVSHDLKAPLRGIDVLAKWISSDYADKLDEEGKENLALLSNRVNRMHKLIEGILQYSRVGRIKEEITPVNLNKLVREIADAITTENITIKISNELPVIEFEKTRIIQVFQNLLSNAVKYMDKPQGEINISCTEDNNFWKFSIADNGPGIEERYFEKIFQIFQTLSSRDETESTGIGLTLIKKIIEFYNGKVWLESKVGEGTTFFFTVLKQQEKIEDTKPEESLTQV